MPLRQGDEFHSVQPILRATYHLDQRDADDRPYHRAEFPRRLPYLLTTTHHFYMSAPWTTDLGNPWKPMPTFLGFCPIQPDICKRPLGCHSKERFFQHRGKVISPKLPAIAIYSITIIIIAAPRYRNALSTAAARRMGTEQQRNPSSFRRNDVIDEMTQAALQPDWP